MKRMIATTAGLVLAGSALTASAFPVGEVLEYDDNYGSVLVTQPSGGIATSGPEFGGQTGMRSSEKGMHGMSESLHGSAIDYGDNYGSILIGLKKGGETATVRPGFGRGMGAGEGTDVNRGDDAYGNVLFDLPRGGKLITY
ncbi:MAG TPA: hypothetical protein VKA64_04430 [Gammaproteobacteria bacterium]|nr:hypothetical protein [Gammaproteobacteria bacterium]